MTIDWLQSFGGTATERASWPLQQDSKGSVRGVCGRERPFGTHKIQENVPLASVRPNRSVARKGTRLKSAKRGKQP